MQTVCSVNNINKITNYINYTFLGASSSAELMIGYSSENKTPSSGYEYLKA